MELTSPVLVCAFLLTLETSSFTTTTALPRWHLSRSHSALPPVRCAWKHPRNPARPDFPTFHLFGNLTQARDLIATASALGWNISRGWDLAGPVRCDLRWQGVAFPWRTQPTGSIDWGGESGEMSLRTPFLNQPIENIRAPFGLETRLSPHLALISRGLRRSLERLVRSASNPADGSSRFRRIILPSADVDRWLNPQWRESFLDRMLPFLNTRSSTNAVTDNLHASGRMIHRPIRAGSRRRTPASGRSESGGPPHRAHQRARPVLWRHCRCVI